MIVRTRGGGSVEVRDVTLAAMVKASGGELRSSGSTVPVTSQEVAGLPAWKQGIRIAAEAVMRLDLAVFRGKPEERRRVETTWQARLFADRPNDLYPWSQCLEMTEASLTARANAYWLKIEDEQARVAEVYVVHPDDIQARWGDGRPEYRVRRMNGTWSEWLTSREILHFRHGFPTPAALVAPSPIEEHKRSLRSALARTTGETDSYDKGLAQSVAVVFPENVTPEQAERWKEVYLSSADNSRVKVFGGNPRIETIGLSASDMQYIESQTFSIYDVGRILGVPPSLLWAATAGNDKPLSPEHEEDRWYRYGLAPRRKRIEDAIRHDTSFFGAGARDYPGFVADPIKGDVAAESEALVREVQAGILLVDEARAKRGYGPLPGGVGKIPQITPVGGAPNEPQPTPEPAENDDDDERVRRSRDLVSLPRIDIHIPEQRVPDVIVRPEIRVEAPTIEIPAPEVRVEVPTPEVRVEVAAAEVVVPDVIVNVPTPDVTVENHVEVKMPSGKRKVDLERSPVTGLLSGATIEDDE